MSNTEDGRKWILNPEYEKATHDIVAGPCGPMFVPRTIKRNPEFDSAVFELKVMSSKGTLLPLYTPVRWSTREAAERDFVRINAGLKPAENVPEFITVNDQPDAP